MTGLTKTSATRATMTFIARSRKADGDRGSISVAVSSERTAASLVSGIGLSISTGFPTPWSSTLVPTSRDEDCGKAGPDPYRRTDYRSDFLPLTPDNHFVTSAQTQLVKRQSPGDRLTHLIRGPVFATCSPDDSPFNVRCSSRTAREHDCLGDGKIRPEGEIALVRDLTKDGDPRKWRDFNLLGLHILEHFRGNSIFELRPQYSGQRQHRLSRQIDDSTSAHEERIGMSGV